uniref:Odorant receptor 54 n=1 Tax=Athetis dissimilis TaxID=1737331 RepID=A0A0S1TQ21_ATHDI|nr:odorant receptor 54 [Athetis dissimilis]
MQRPTLLTALKKIGQNDKMALVSIPLKPKHEQMMKVVKRIVLVFYGFNYFNGFFIHFPYRIDVTNNSTMTPCVGMEPLTATPNKQICLILLAAQEMTIVVVVLNFQALLLFLIAHTAAMYQMLAYEMDALRESLNENLLENMELIRETLSTMIVRHSLTMDVVDLLKSLYSVPLGVNFCTNAVCICLFFYLPLREWLQFMPLLVYCFVVFFLYCFLGQRLVNSAELFERMVYSCGWENFEMKEKRLVLVMLRQTQKRVELLAADIIPVNIYTFATTMQAIFKFITVVKF